MNTNLHDIHFRSEQQTDLSAIRRVHLLAFPSEMEANLVDALRSAGKAVVALVAEAPHGSIVGHIVFSPVRIDNCRGGGNYVALAPLAVLPEAQHQGIGSALVRAGLAQCAALGYHGVIVLGAPQFYSRFDFTPAQPLGLSSRFGHDDCLQVWQRVPGTLPADGGRVEYDEMFGD
jgi:putative acetyltransferase